MGPDSAAIDLNDQFPITLKIGRIMLLCLKIKDLLTFYTHFVLVHHSAIIDLFRDFEDDFTTPLPLW